MNEKQKKIQGMVLELFEALREIENPTGGFEDAVEIMDGIQDGSFFRLPVDVHCRKLGWLNGAFFGRGERAIPILIAGFLPDHFAKRFSKLLHEYWESVDGYGDEPI